MDGITFSKAVDGYRLYAHGRQLSENTLREYANTFRRFSEFLDGDPPLESITLDVVEGFFGNLTDISKKTALNYHTGLSALWTWALARGIVGEHVIRQYKPPKAPRAIIEVFTEDEVARLLHACDRTPAYKRKGKKQSSHSRPTRLRDRAIVLTLLDSMVRASELCGMRRSDTRLSEGRIKVMGKGARERWVPISPETSGAIWQYIAARPRAKPRYDDNVFLTRSLRPLNRWAVGRMCRATRPTSAC